MKKDIKCKKSGEKTEVGPPFWSGQIWYTHEQGFLVRHQNMGDIEGEEDPLFCGRPGEEEKREKPSKVDPFKKLSDIAHLVVMEHRNGEIDIGEENEQDLAEVLMNLPGDPYKYKGNMRGGGLKW